MPILGERLLELLKLTDGEDWKLDAGTGIFSNKFGKFNLSVVEKLTDDEWTIIVEMIKAKKPFEGLEGITLYTR